jgi:hypothetical protein
MRNSSHCSFGMPESFSWSRNVVSSFSEVNLTARAWVSLQASGSQCKEMTSCYWRLLVLLSNVTILHKTDNTEPINRAQHTLH